MILLIDSLLDRKTNKEFKDICAKMAVVQNKKAAFEKKFLQKTSKETINEVLDIIAGFGHPEEVNKSTEIREKYQSGERLDFEDIVSLVSLYKSNYSKCDNKE